MKVIFLLLVLLLSRVFAPAYMTYRPPPKMDDIILEPSVWTKRSLLWGSKGVGFNMYLISFWKTKNMGRKLVKQV